MRARIMDKARFLEIVQCYGADPRRWPTHERAEAEAFMTAHGDAAREVLGEARELDILLARAPEPEPPSADLRSRILDAAPQTVRAPAFVPAFAGVSLPVGFGGMRSAAAAFAMSFCLVVGVAGGYYFGSASATRATDQALFELALDIDDAFLNLEEG